MKSTHCEGCANLFPVSIWGEVQVLCLATAQFVGGPLRPDMDLQGVIRAETRNAGNDCERFTRVNLRVKKYQQWIERYQHGGKISLEDYGRREEQLFYEWGKDVGVEADEEEYYEEVDSSESGESVEE